MSIVVTIIIAWVIWLVVFAVAYAALAAATMLFLAVTRQTDQYDHATGPAFLAAQGLAIYLALSYAGVIG